MADEPLPVYTPYTENVHNDAAAADYMDEDSDDDTLEPEYPTILFPPPPYHAAAGSQRDPPTYNVAIPTLQSERRRELRVQWETYTEGKRSEHRRNYVVWKRTRGTTPNNSASGISDATLAGAPSSSSPPTPIPLSSVPTATPVSSPPPPAVPLTTRQRAKRALVELPAKLGCSLAKAIMLDKMASWATKTRHWKKTKRDYVKEVSGERNLFVGAVRTVYPQRPATDPVSPRPFTPGIRVVPLHADSVRGSSSSSIFGAGSDQGGRGYQHRESTRDSWPGTAAGLTGSGALLKRVGSLSKNKKKIVGEEDFPIPQLGRRASRRRPGKNPGLLAQRGVVS